ncbi:MAG: DUF4136 domain-containing protein [Cyclobacteriaceae bacterium]|jgi:hypothetical protein
MKFLWVVLILLAGCGVQVIQYVNVSAPFQNFDDYILIGLKGTNLPTTEIEDDIRPRLEAAIQAEMERRNYSENSQNPDLIVRYEIVTGTVTQRNTNNNMFGFVPGMMPIYNYNQAVESVLLLEILSSSNRKLVWQSSVDLRDHSKKTKRKDVLAAAVEKMFDTYLYVASKRTPSPELLNK